MDSYRMYNLHLILHLGTNNIGNRHLNMREKPVIFLERLKIFLIDLLNVNPRIYITFSSIIARSDIEQEVIITDKSDKLQYLLKFSNFLKQISLTDNGNRRPQPP